MPTTPASAGTSSGRNGKLASFPRTKNTVSPTPAPTASTATSVPNDNIHAGKYRPVVQNRLSDATFAGFSATAWYLFRDPQILAPMVVSFLNGVETPTVESADADFDQLGIQFRGYHDFGVDFAEWLSGLKSKGAA